MPFRLLLICESSFQKGSERERESEGEREREKGREREVASRAREFV